MDVIFRCHFCFKKKSYDIKKEKHNSGRADSWARNPQFYPVIYVAHVTLLSCPLSTCAAEGSFSGMMRLTTPHRSTMSEQVLSSLAILHMHKHKRVDIDKVVSEFFRREGRRLALFPYPQLQFINTLSAYTYISNTQVGCQIENKVTE